MSDRWVFGLLILANAIGTAALIVMALGIFGWLK